MLRLELLRTKRSQGAKAEAEAIERAMVAAASFMVTKIFHQQKIKFNLCPLFNSRRAEALWNMTVQLPLAVISSVASFMTT